MLTRLKNVCFKGDVSVPFGGADGGKGYTHQHPMQPTPVGHGGGDDETTRGNVSMYDCRSSRGRFVGR